jgi:hypothetical protein
MTRVVGVYICPRGVFGVECNQRAATLEVIRSFESHGRIESLPDGARLLNRTLAQNDIKRAQLAVAVRGFGAVHHVLAFPPAPEDVLDPVIAREVRRLEQQLPDPVVAWTRLVEAERDQGPGAQSDVLTAALPRAAVTEFVRALDAGHTLQHLTVLSSAMHRLAEEFLPPVEPSAIIAQFPDGPFLGYAVEGAIRLAVEPPVNSDDALPDAMAVADEAELGALFVRQQFRGAQISQAIAVASDDTYPAVEEAVSSRLGVIITRLPLAGLTPGGVAAFGALLDARSSNPIAIAGVTAERRALRGTAKVRLVANALLVVATVVGAWAASQALAARGTAKALGNARQRIEQESSSLAPARETADRRRIVRDAVAALREVQSDQAALQRGLVSISAAVPNSISLDSMVLERSAGAWQTTLGGSVVGQTSGAAVQSLGTFYRDLSKLSLVDSVALKQLTYADTTGRSLVRFEIGLGMRVRSRN